MTDLYEKVIRLAVEYVHVVAARRGWDTGQIIVEIDTGRAEGVHPEHTVKITMRDGSVGVISEGIPHDWIETSTGFVDKRFSQRIAMLLAELESKWHGSF